MFFQSFRVFFIINFFLMLYNYSYNFIKISLLSFIFWNYIIYLYILFFFLDEMFYETLKYKVISYLALFITSF